MIHYTKTIALLATMFLGLSISVAQDYSKPDSAVYDPYATDTASSFLESGKASKSTTYDAGTYDYVLADGSPGKVYFTLYISINKPIIIVKIINF